VLAARADARRRTASATERRHARATEEDSIGRAGVRAGEGRTRNACGQMRRSTVAAMRWPSVGSKQKDTYEALVVLGLDFCLASLGPGRGHILGWARFAWCLSTVIFVATRLHATGRLQVLGAQCKTQNGGPAIKLS
jgi:hypothetical protein